MPTATGALTPAERKQRQRALAKGRPDPFAEYQVTKEQIAARDSQHVIHLAWATEQDATGKFYRDECRSCTDLLAIYEGANILDKESDDEEVEDKKKPGKKKSNRPNPSIQKITIRAIEYNGIKLEPNCQPEFKLLKEVNEIVSFQRWLDLRSKGRQDLLWLGRLLGKGLFHSVHQYVCDQFVKKNFEGMYFPGFSIDDFHDMIRAQKRFANDGVTLVREMILLESRGAYKSTIDGIDCAQWIINCPDIRIMVMTGVKGLAKKFAKEIKKYFYLPQKAEPTAFHLLYPEFVLTGVDGRSEMPMECPASFFNQKESNLWVTSIESSSTGDHCDVRKADDVVTSKNSETVELREKLKFEFDGTDDNLDQWGFSDVIGTRYFTDDWYGTRALPNEDTGEVAPYKYSCRGCWTLHPEYREAYNNGTLRLKDITESMVTLTFPYKLDWKYLRKTLNKKGERSFKNQQLNEPTDAGKDSPYINEFTEEILRAHCYPKESAPKVGEIIQTWDTAYGEKRTSDFSVGVTAIIYQNKEGKYGLCVLDMIYDKWKSSELSFQMLQFYKKWNPTRIRIEKANGSGWLADNLAMTAGKYGVAEITSKIIWDEIDTSTNAKRNRIKSLEFLVADDRLHFVNGLYVDEMIKQMTKFTGEKSTASRKDDIPDALSFLLRFLPKSALMSPDDDPGEAEKETEEAARVAQMKAMHNRMFGDSSGLPNVITQVNPETEESKPDPRREMLSRLFGGNGMRA